MASMSNVLGSAPGRPPSPGMDDSFGPVDEEAWAYTEADALGAAGSGGSGGCLDPGVKGAWAQYDDGAGNWYSTHKHIANTDTTSI